MPSEMFSLGFASAEEFRIAQTEAGTLLSKACSCQVVLEEWRASQS